MSNRYAINITLATKRDIKDIFRYIAFTLNEPLTAKTQINRIKEEFLSLLNLPMRYPLTQYEPWKREGIRHVKVGNYIIYYLPKEETAIVNIMHVIYAGRDLNLLSSSR